MTTDPTPSREEHTMSHSDPGNVVEVGPSEFLDAYTGPEWLTMRDELTTIIGRAAATARHDVEEHRIIGEHLIARGIINPRALAAEVESRAGSWAGFADRSAAIVVHDPVSTADLGCKEAACENGDVHEHGAACGRLCPECRGRDGR